MKGYGTDLYYAPELWNASSLHGLNTCKVDIYAMGIVFYQLANLSYPYEMISDHRSMHMNSAIKPFNKEVDLVFQSLIRRMLEKPISKRFDDWKQIKDFLCSSSIGSGIEREEIVESLLMQTAKKQQVFDERTAQENMERQLLVDAFKRLISQIDSEIYKPLCEIVNAFNKDSGKVKMHLDEMVIDEEDETCSFELTKDPIEKDKFDESIVFRFTAIHDKVEDYNDYIPIFSGYSGGVISSYPNYSKKVEYKFGKDKILLWGTVEADCGVGISVGILEDKNDELYGKLKIFKRVPNIHGYNYYFSISENNLEKCVLNNFTNIHYTIETSDFDFTSIKELILLNEKLDGERIDDPYEHFCLFN